VCIAPDFDANSNFILEPLSRYPVWSSARSSNAGHNWTAAKGSRRLFQENTDLANRHDTVGDRHDQRHTCVIDRRCYFRSNRHIAR